MSGKMYTFHEHCQNVDKTNEIAYHKPANPPLKFLAQMVHYVEDCGMERAVVDFLFT